jgi:hypothetical protein
MKQFNIPHDKALHFLISALMLMYLTEFFSLMYATIIALLIGAAKEYIWDYKIGKGVPDWYDMLANTLGVLVSLGVVWVGRLL